MCRAQKLVLITCQLCTYKNTVSVISHLDLHFNFEPRCAAIETLKCLRELDPKMILY